MAVVVLTAIGFVLFEGSFQNTDGRVLANIGATAYLFGGVLLVAAEALSLNLGFEKLYPVIVIYVVMAPLSPSRHRGRFASGRVGGWLDRLGHHPLEHRVVGRAFPFRAA